MCFYCTSWQLIAIDICNQWLLWKALQCSVKADLKISLKFKQLVKIFTRKSPSNSHGYNVYIQGHILAYSEKHASGVCQCFPALFTSLWTASAGSIQKWMVLLISKALRVRLYAYGIELELFCYIIYTLGNSFSLLKGDIERRYHPPESVQLPNYIYFSSDSEFSQLKSEQSWLGHSTWTSKGWSVTFSFRYSLQHIRYSMSHFEGCILRRSHLLAGYVIKAASFQ